MRPPDNTDVAVRHDTSILLGWSLFLSGSLGCAAVSFGLYGWVMVVGAGMIRFLADGFLCVPLCWMSFVGFVQIVSGTSCFDLPKVWRSLAISRKLLILSFVLGVILFLSSFTYFLFWMSPEPTINSNI